MPKIIINKKDCVFVEVESGKPYKDGVTQTVQKPQTGAGCFFSSMNMIRDRYHVPQYEGTNERAIEKKVSCAKKLIQSITEKYLAIMCNLRVFAQSKMVVTDKNVDAFLDLCNSADTSTHTPEMLKEAKYFVAFLTEFKNRENKKSETGIEYATRCEHLELSKTIEEIKKLLEIDDLEVLYKETFPMLAIESPWDKMPDQAKNALSITLIQKKCYQLSLLTASTWKPEKNSFEDLLDQLKSNGPMLVCGRYGKLFYKKNAEQLKYAHKVDDQTINCIGFRADDYIDISTQATSLKMAHSVVLVGGNIINNKPFIYYIDPLDVSLPSEKRTVYVMSYENFCKRMLTINASTPTQDNGQPYALYNPNCKL